MVSVPFHCSSEMEPLTESCRSLMRQGDRCLFSSGFAGAASSLAPSSDPEDLNSGSHFVWEALLTEPSASQLHKIYSELECLYGNRITIMMMMMIIIIYNKIIIICYYYYTCKNLQHFKV